MQTASKTLSLGPTEVEIMRTLWVGNLVTFLVVMLGAAALAAVSVATWFSVWSVAVGGLIALANFKLLQRNINKSLADGTNRKVLPKALVKFYLKFAATCLVLFLLVRQGVVEPLGLLVGLSVVIMTIMVWGAFQARRLSKEAA